MNIKQFMQDLIEIRKLPTLTVDLLYSGTKQNDPFYERIVREFYENTRRRHRKFPFVRQNEYGVCLCELPDSFDRYFMKIEAAGRRNYKKASRLGYEFRKIDYNEYLEDILEIRRSADVRQGPMPDNIIHGEVRKNQNPPTRTNLHDYPYFGILKEGRLFAYAGCFIAGELFSIEHIYGHAKFHNDGVVPMLIIDMAKIAMEEYSKVRYFCYGTYYGAGTSMRRFKKKFLFLPCRVKWILG